MAVNKSKDPWRVGVTDIIDDAAIGFSGRADREDSSFGKTYRTMAGKLDRITGKAGLSIYASEIMKFNYTRHAIIPILNSHAH